jgi:tetratricopeptide (TPR) repeat protein
MFGAADAVADDTPAGKAQALLNRAYAEPDASKRAALAREVLLTWPDCTDAFILLAENAPSQKEALALYEQAVAAAERALGPEVFSEQAGNFWLLLETRPYMRARLGLAFTLWAVGRREEAVQHAQELLRLHPHDNQGVRYTLAAWLLNLDRDEDLAQLLRQYDEDSATWLYTRALLAFRQEGESDEARRLLREAKKANKHVPAYLLGEKLLPAQPPDGYVPGESSEAIQYAGTYLAGWRNTEGAISWLRQTKKKPKKKQEEEPVPVGPLPIVRQRLRKLPQRADAWQVGWAQLSDRVRTDTGPVHPWAVLVASETSQLIFGHAISLEEPTAVVLWDTLAQAMERPVAGQSYRPTSLHVRADARWEELRPHLDELGIRLEYGGDFELIDTILHGLAAGVARQSEMGLLDIPGVGPEQAGRFYEAAAFFYRQAPWKRIGYESAIKIESAKYPDGPYYAVIMGQSGMVMGVALYDDLSTLKRLWSGQMSDEENARDTVATAVTFADPEEVPPSDLEAARQYGWAVARRDAYPLIYRKERGDIMRLPEAWELELLEACLRAIPPFVQRHRADDSTREEMVVPVASGEVTLGLSWVVDL